MLNNDFYLSFFDLGPSFAQFPAWVSGGQQKRPVRESNTYGQYRPVRKPGPTTVPQHSGYQSQASYQGLGQGQGQGGYSINVFNEAGNSYSILDGNYSGGRGAGRGGARWRRE